MQWNTTHAICSNKDGPRDYHTKLGRSEKERQIPYGTTYVWNLSCYTNELTYETETDSQAARTDLWLPRMRGWGREELGVWISTGMVWLKKLKNKL